MERKVTRNDVAKLAGVSPAVVSYVINESNYVSEEKKAAVRKAIKELNYTPNVFAKSLRTNKSNQIALVGDTLQAELYGALATHLFEKGYFSSLFYSCHDESFIRRLIEGRFDAVFMASNAFSAKQLNEIAESGIPLVLYRSREYVGLDPRIVVRAPDLVDGVRKVLGYLILKGHHRIAYIPPLKYKTQGVFGDDLRAKTYSETLRKNGIEINEDFFSIHTDSEQTVLEDVFNMMTMYTREERPTAIAVSDDHLAAQILQYIKKLNLRVPADVAIIGYGNIASSQITTPELTTFDSNIEYFAADVADALVRMTEGERPEDRLYKGKMVIRDST